MTKVAKLVCVTLLTRVIVEEGADQQAIMEEAVPKLSETLMDSPFENIDKIVDDVLMPDPKDDGSDAWEHGDFLGRIVSFKEFDNVIYATVEDGDDDCFDIEAERLQGCKQY